MSDINESEFVDIIKNVITEEENTRIRRPYTVNAWDIKKFPAMGVTPYYYDSNVNGECKMVQITTENVSKHIKGYIFLLKPEEFDKITRYIDSLNKLIKLELERIKLLKEMIPSILKDKIMN